MGYAGAIGAAALSLDRPRFRDLLGYAGFIYTF